MKFNVKNSFAGSMLLVGALTLAACSPANENDSVTDTEDGTETSATQIASNGDDATLAVTGAYVRASVEGSPMTAVFGTLTNTTDEEITLAGFEASIDAAAYEIHEVVDGVMREKEGGLLIPAGESHELAPGQDHLMLMGLAAPIEAGDTVDVTLILDDGTEIELDPVPVRTVAAGDESYGEDGELMGHDGVDDSAHQ
ncbi:hypothetical protein CFAEC_07985 [Corynebacterium faecale]|uniref:copper chaperone PCu(A)C n=1 Tax=Corynebacterium faecale TaxID=1758466 RepID=UPI0025B3A41F|nr:copper chaperone PCu(A)C [Corynebacterium faecale]WJY92421.1 hypothetical protein CFAEC_07985 [Corynebacterium faecale]